MKPLKAFPYETKRLQLPCFAQPKLNGVRALYQRGKFYSGDEHEWHQPILQHLASELAEVLHDSSTILDGELYVHGWSLQRINGAVAVKRLSPVQDTLSIEFHVFDCVNLKDPFIDRHMRVKSLLGNSLEHIRVVPTDLVFDQAHADSFYEMRVREGYEGAIYRMGECRYTLVGHGCNNKENRVPHMLKRKAWKDADFRIVGVQEGLPTDLGGKYVGSLGAFILETTSGRTFTAAPSFTDDERLWYFHNQPLGRLAQVKFLNLSDEGIPLHPIVMCVREA